MGYTPINNSEIQVGKFTRQELWQKVKDDFDYLYGSVGDFHSLIPNASFEMDSDANDVADFWTFSTYQNGAYGLSPSVVLGTDGLNYTCILAHTAAADNKPITGANYATYWTQKGSNGATWTLGKRYKSQIGAHGNKCIWFERITGAGNGGGYATSDYVEITQTKTYTLEFILWSSVAGLRNKVEVLFYDKDKVYLSATELYNSTSNPTSPQNFISASTIPTNARFAKIRLHGGFTDPDVAGIIYFDGIEMKPYQKGINFTGEITQKETLTTTDFVDVGSFQIFIPVGTTKLRFRAELWQENATYIAYMRFRIGSNYSQQLNTSQTTPQIFDFDITIPIIVNDLQIIYMQLKSNSSAFRAYGRKIEHLIGTGVFE